MGLQHMRPANTRLTYVLMAVMRTVGKGLFGHMRTAKIQMSVRIRAVRSWHSLFVDINYPLSPLSGNTGPNQSLHSRRLIIECVARKLHKSPFHALRINNVLDFSPHEEGSTLTGKDGRNTKSFKGKTFRRKCPSTCTNFVHVYLRYGTRVY